MAKYDSATTEGKCIFCEITSGRITPKGNGTIWEDEKFIAWLSPFPSTEGNTVVVPKKHFPSDVLGMPDKDLEELVLAAKKVSQVLIKSFEDVGRVGLIMEGTGINHAHIKLIPMHGTQHLKRGEWKQHLSGKNEYHALYEGYLVSCDGPAADLVKLEALAKRIRATK